MVGADAYLARVEAMDLPSARFSLSVTQIVAPRPEQVMVRPGAGRSLHNHAAHLLSVRGGRIGEWWMVEALPADSDAFWSAE